MARWCGVVLAAGIHIYAFPFSFVHYLLTLQIFNILFCIEIFSNCSNPAHKYSQLATASGIVYCHTGTFQQNLDSIKIIDFRNGFSLWPGLIFAPAHKTNTSPSNKYILWQDQTERLTTWYLGTFLNVENPPEESLESTWRFTWESDQSSPVFWCQSCAQCSPSQSSPVFFVSALYSICWCQPQISVTVSLSLLQWNCNEARITHNLLYIIMHIIPELEFLTF